MAAWWHTEEEPPPQSRIGAARRPVEEKRARRGRGPKVRRPSWVTLYATVAAVLFVGFFGLIAYTAFRGIDGSAGGADSHDGPSLIRSDRFARALEKAKDEAGPEASLVALRLDPDEAAFVVRLADGNGALIRVLPDLHVGVSAGGGAGPRGTSLNRIDPAVPERLVRRAAERQLRDPEDISYLALSSVENPVYRGGVWSIFFEGATGPPLNAYLDGSNLRDPGEPG